MFSRRLTFDLNELLHHSPVVVLSGIQTSDVLSPALQELFDSGNQYKKRFLIEVFTIALRNARSLQFLKERGANDVFADIWFDRRPK
jgi:hypothetical protein